MNYIINNNESLSHKEQAISILENIDELLKNILDIKLSECSETSDFIGGTIKRSYILCDELYFEMLHKKYKIYHINSSLHYDDFHTSLKVNITIENFIYLPYFDYWVYNMPIIESDSSITQHKILNNVDEATAKILLAVSKIINPDTNLTINQLIYQP